MIKPKLKLAFSDISPLNRSFELTVVLIKNHKVLEKMIDKLDLFRKEQISLFRYARVCFL